MSTIESQKFTADEALDILTESLSYYFPEPVLVEKEAETDANSPVIEYYAAA
ncbi:MAG: hypothetical protein ACPGNV_00850 [Mangrovicoccus sp.]